MPQAPEANFLRVRFQSILRFHVGVLRLLLTCRAGLEWRDSEPGGHCCQRGIRLCGTVSARRGLPPSVA